MNIIEPSVKLIDIPGYGKKIEYAGRICYKSHDKINDSSHLLFINSIAKRGHYSVIEHEKFTVAFDDSLVYKRVKKFFEEKFYWNKFFDITEISSDNKPYNTFGAVTKSANDRVFGIVTGNLRAWLDLFNSLEERDTFTQSDDALFIFAISNELRNLYGNLFKAYNVKRLYIKEHWYSKKVEVWPYFSRFAFMPDDTWIKESLPVEEANKHIYKTFHIVTDRAVTHQLVRHRLNSFSQESQRYVNYTLEKFDSSIRFIVPYDLRNELKDNEKSDASKLFISSCKAAEKNYFKFIDLGIKPEVARCVLPNCVATEIVTTASIEQWNRFLDLRCDAHAQADIRDIANQLKTFF